MVQEKDAARKREQARRQARERTLKDIEKNTVRIKWQVIEHTPAYETYDDVRYPAKNVVVADEFETEVDAQAWMDAHEPDRGNTLRLRSRRLVKRVDYVWM